MMRKATTVGEPVTYGSDNPSVDLRKRGAKRGADKRGAD